MNIEKPYIHVKYFPEKETGVVREEFYPLRNNSELQTVEDRLANAADMGDLYGKMIFLEIPTYKKKTFLQLTSDIENIVFEYA